MMKIPASNNAVDNFIKSKELITNIVKESDLFPEIKDFAVSIIKNIHPTDHFEQVKTIFNYLQSRYKYVKDINNVECFKRPITILNELREKGYFWGDCDDASIFLGTLLRSIGFKIRFEILAINYPKYNHIRVAVKVKDQWIPLDLTKKDGINPKKQSLLNLLVFEV